MNSQFIRKNRIFRDKQYLLPNQSAQFLEMSIPPMSKIENEEKQLQSHMLNGLSELFDLDYKEMQIQLLNQKIENEYGDEPFINEALQMYLTKKNK